MIAAPPVPQATPSISFADARHGWVGGRGGILGTSDGRRFRLQVRRAVTAVDAVDASSAFALGADGRLLRTRDGSHWTTVPSPALAKIDFADSSHGLGLGRDGRARLTSDGGVRWPTVGPPRVESVCASSGGAYLARAGTVWRSVDGGRTWQRRTIVRAQQGFPVPELACRGRDVWLLLHEGGAAGSEAYVVFVSRDRGATWRPRLANLDRKFGALPRVSNTSGPFVALGDGAAVLAGTCGACGRYQPTTTFARTADGGRSFRRSTPFDGYSPYALSFADARTGFVVTTARRGADPIVWSTHDGGRTWRPLLRSHVLSPP